MHKTPGSDWTRLDSVRDWEAYKAGVSGKLNTSPENVEWGRGPKDYPCLIATAVVPTSAAAGFQVYSAYVYRSEAENLLSTETRPAAAGTPKPPQGDRQQAAFNRWISAQMITVIHYLTETGIAQPVAFEEKLLEMLEKVDAYRNKTDGWQQGLSEAQIAVLNGKAES